MEEADGSVPADRDEGEQGDAMEIEGQEDIGAKGKQDGAQEREFSMESIPIITWCLWHTQASIVGGIILMCC